MSEFVPKAHPRREERFEHRMPVTLRSGKYERVLYTFDISFRGLFVCTDEPPVLRELITVEASLQPGDTLFFSHAMSVFIQKPNGDGPLPPGIGVQFYAQSNEDRRNWTRFVTLIRGQANQPPLATAIPNHHGLSPTVIAELILRPENSSELRRLCVDKVGRGEIEVCTDLHAKVGDEVLLKLLHPENDELISFEAEVSVVTASNSPRLTLSVPELDKGKRRELWDFLGPGLSLK